MHYIKECVIINFISGVQDYSHCIQYNLVVVLFGAWWIRQGLQSDMPLVQVMFHSFRWCGAEANHFIGGLHLSYTVFCMHRVMALLSQYVNAWKQRMLQCTYLTFQNTSLKHTEASAFRRVEVRDRKLFLPPEHVFNKWSSSQFAVKYFSVLSSITDMRAMLKVNARVGVTLRHLIT